MKEIREKFALIYINFRCNLPGLNKVIIILKKKTLSINSQDEALAVRVLSDLYLAHKSTGIIRKSTYWECLKPISAA